MDEEANLGRGQKLDPLDARVADLFNPFNEEKKFKILLV